MSFVFIWLLHVILLVPAIVKESSIHLDNISKRLSVIFSWLKKMMGFMIPHLLIKCFHFEHFHSHDYSHFLMNNLSKLCTRSTFSLHTGMFWAFWLWKPLSVLKSLSFPVTTCVFSCHSLCIPVNTCTQPLYTSRSLVNLCAHPLCVTVGPCHPVRPCHPL